MADIAKLQLFVEAALTNPTHPVYKMGMQHSPILQHYAINVSMLQSIKPEQWFKDYPDKTAKLTEVMRLCEEVEATEDATKDELDTLKSEVAALKAKIIALQNPEPIKPVEEEPIAAEA